MLYRKSNNRSISSENLIEAFLAYACQKRGTVVECETGHAASVSSGDCMGPAMAVFAGVETGTGKKAGEGRLSWPVLLLMLAVFTSSSLSAFSLYQLMALRAEVEGLKSDVCRRRQEGQEAKHGAQVSDNNYWSSGT